MWTTAPDQAVEHWLQEASSDTGDDRRENQRHPFFRSVSVTPSGAPEEKSPAFSRDISLTGIGLLQNAPLNDRQATLSIPTTAGHQVEVEVEVMWSRPGGQGWYLIGARFLGLSVAQKSMLLSATVATEVARRSCHRYPFFRPVTVKIQSAQTIGVSAFSRDISLTSIGLLHDAPLNSQHVALAVPTTEGDEVDVRAEVKWCKPCGEGWYLSRVQFKQLRLAELPEFRP